MESLLEIVTQPKTWSDLNGEAKIKIIRLMGSGAHNVSRTITTKCTEELLKDITRGHTDFTYFLHGVGMPDLEFEEDGKVKTDLTAPEWAWLDYPDVAKTWDKEQWELTFTTMSSLIPGHILEDIIRTDGLEDAEDLLIRLINTYYRNKEYGELRPVVMGRKAALAVQIRPELIQKR